MRLTSHFDYALTCHVDELAAQGFGRSDIRRYVAWKRGKKLDPPVDSDEVRRFGYLALLVILSDTTPVPTEMPAETTPPPAQALDMVPPPDLPDAIEGVTYTQTITAIGGIPPYAWDATGVPSWATVTISTDTTQWTISGLPPMSEEMDAVVLTLSDSS